MRRVRGGADRKCRPASCRRRFATLKSDSDAISSSSSLVAQDADMRACCAVGGARSTGWCGELKNTEVSSNRWRQGWANYGLGAICGLLS